MTPTTAPTGATSPSTTRISLSTPASMAGTSIETLSVSISNRLSPGCTVSPADLNHLVILPSATVSPSCGMRMFIAARRISPVHRDVLRFQKFLQSLMRAFAAKAGLLDAAEGRGGIGNEAAVHADHAEVELFRDAHAAGQILGVEVGDQSVLGVVGAADDLVLRPESLDRRDRAEDLLVEHLGVVGDVGEHGRRVEETGSGGGLAAGEHLGPLLHRVVDQLDHLVAAILVD